jgi:hypothetical protein
MAEAYLNSLQLDGWAALSSGTAATVHKEINLPNHALTLELLGRHGVREFAKAGYADQLTQARLEKADITVCLNQRVYDEGRQIVTFTSPPIVWSVADVGEPGRMSAAESDRLRYREETYQEIAANVGRLVADISAANRRTAS